MRELLSELSDIIDDKTPENYHHILLIFPEGDGQVDVVASLDDSEELIRRIHCFLYNLQKETTHINNDE